MAELKTKKNRASVPAFIKAIDDDTKRADAKQLLKIMGDITGEKPAMWGDAIVGFGSYHYVYDSGREGDWFLTGFSPRKQAMTLYIMGGFDGHDELLEKLGKHKTGKSCLYVKQLDDLHLPTLKKLIRSGVKRVKARSA